MLLHHKNGPTCYKDLKTVNIDGKEVVNDTFQEACLMLGLIDDDREINKAMKDATSITFGESLRYFFCSLLILCRPVTPLQFWNEWKTELCRDKMIKERLTEPNSLMIAQVLTYIKRRLHKEELSMADFNLPEPDTSVIEAAEEISMLQEETNYDEEALNFFVQQQYQKLNVGQKKYSMKL